MGRAGERVFRKGKRQEQQCRGRASALELGARRDVRTGPGRPETGEETRHWCGVVLTYSGEPLA